MNKSIITFSWIVLLISTFCIREASAFDPPILGDANKDGLVTLSDAQIVAKYKVGGFSLFHVGDILDWPDFCLKLTQDANESWPNPGKRIWGMLPWGIQSLIENSSAGTNLSEKDKSDIVVALNSILKRRDFYQEEDFSTMDLPEEAQELLAIGPNSLSGSNLQKLNRLLIEAAYPYEIAINQADISLGNVNPCDDISMLDGLLISTYVKNPDHPDLPHGIGVGYIDFADLNLEEAVRVAWSVPAGNHVAHADLRDNHLITFNADEKDIGKLDGIQFLAVTRCGIPNIPTQISLANNRIDDVSHLAGHTQLTRLDLSENQISNITPLGNLTQLTELYLGTNDIGDVNSLTNLTQLTKLHLDSNDISNITPLANLTQLTELSIGYNSISNTSILNDLPELRLLNMQGSTVSTISLAAHLQLQTLLIDGSVIGDMSLEDLPELETLSLSNAQINTLSLNNLPKLELESLFLEGSLFHVDDILDWPDFCSKLTQDANQSWPNPGKRIWSMLPPEIQSLIESSSAGTSLSEQDKSYIVVALNSILKRWSFYREEDFSTTDLPEEAQELLALHPGNLSGSDLQKLNRLLIEAAYPDEIAKSLYLENAQINTLSLTNLFHKYDDPIWYYDLLLPNHHLVSVSLNNLSALRYLDLSSNSITNISLTDLPRLQQIKLDNNNINNLALLTGLADLTQLTSLDLSSNQISNISPLGNLTQLTSLNLSSNQIKDISPLLDLPQLGSVGLIDNPLNDDAFNVHIPALKAQGTVVSHDNPPGTN